MNNTVSSNNVRGIEINDSSNNLVQNNKIYGNVQRAIFLQNTANNVILRNNVSGGWSGIYLTNATYNNITSNNVTASENYAIYLNSSDNNNLTDNNLSYNNATGVLVDSATNNVVLSSNYICNNAMDLDNQGTSNAGSADRCDSFVSWTENGHYGCEYSCSSIWSRFFGNVSGDILLMENDSGLVYNWSGADGFAVYAADVDAVIDWSSLQAIGRTTSNTASANDFVELDVTLNSTNLSDNINHTYSTDGSAPIETDTVSKILANLVIPMSFTGIQSAMFRLPIRQPSIQLSIPGSFGIPQTGVPSTPTPSTSQPCGPYR